MKHPKRIFGGRYSAKMWRAINTAKSIDDLRDALYFVCCRLQELEHKLDDQDVQDAHAAFIDPQNKKPIPWRKQRGDKACRQ